MRLWMGWRGSRFKVICLLITVLILSGRLCHSCTLRNSPPCGHGECGVTLASEIFTAVLIAYQNLSLTPFGCSAFSLSSRLSELVTTLVYSQTSVCERLGSWTVRFTNKFSEHKASRMTYCVSSYEHASRQLRGTINWENPLPNSKQ